MQQRLSPWIRVLYVIAWLPFLGLYLLTFSSTGEMPFPRVLVAGLYYVLPPAALGAIVVRLCVATPWPGHSVGAFFGKHVLFGPAFAMSSAGLTVAAFVLVPITFEELGEAVPLVNIFVGQTFLGLLLYCIIVGFTYAALGEVRSRQQAAAAARAETLWAQAELKALRAQVNPHFLFNTLHTLLILVRRDPQAAEDAIEQFGDLMRYALRVQREERDEVPLAKEWAFARHYLALEELRLGPRLSLATEIDDEALRHVVPAFSLQPLLENSIAHGIAPRAEGGRVTVRAAVDGERLVLEVSDDGPGADDAAIAASNGTGLRLLRQRLAALYGDAGTLTTRATEVGFAVVVAVPARVAPDGAKEGQAL